MAAEHVLREACGAVVRVGVSVFVGRGIETGLYLLIPLAVVALWGRWREYRDGIHALVLLLVVTHMAYLLEIGGDLYEYRPMDFYWPLLAIAAAEGVARLGAGLSGWLQQLSRRLRRFGTGTLAIVLFVPLSFYAGAIQAVLLYEGMEGPRPDGGLPPQVVLDSSNCRVAAGRSGDAGARRHIERPAPEIRAQSCRSKGLSAPQVQRSNDPRLAGLRGIDAPSHSKRCGDIPRRPLE